MATSDLSAQPTGCINCIYDVAFGCTTNTDMQDAEPDHSLPSTVVTLVDILLN